MQNNKKIKLINTLLFQVENDPFKPQIGYKNIYILVMIYIMKDIRFVDRETGKEEIEKIYGRWALVILYGEKPLYRFISFFLLPLFARVSFFSRLYGWMQKQKYSRKKILPFIEHFQVNTEEFQKEVKEFTSFNDFFIRKLKYTARPIAKGSDRAVLFADGRYLVYPDLASVDSFLVKGKRFTLKEFLRDEKLASKYEDGEMVMARLCPTDYHRFHFPFDCIPERPVFIHGPLFSVNPWALQKNIRILSENRRMRTLLKSKEFGEVLYVEIGATYVGSIIQTFAPDLPYKKGDEKGFFSFGGSCVILLFEKGRIRFDDDLVRNSSRGIETKGLFGQSMGVSSR